MRKNKSTVNSLSEYISQIKKHNLVGCYYRGENDNYESISSSLLRSYEPGSISTGAIDLYNRLLANYYQEVGYELDQMQSEYFLAFSQHHGLKTNLIDFTTAPLVALYFACERSNYNVDRGYVYVLKKNSTVDASDYINKYSFGRNFVHNILTGIAQKNQEAIREFELLLEKYAGLFSGRNPFELINDMIRLSEPYKFLKSCSTYIENRSKLLGGGNIDAYLNGVNPLISQHLPDILDNGTVAILEFLTLFVLYLNDLQLASYNHDVPPNMKFPRTPFLMYKTPLKFDRIRNQSGIFVYQMFYDYATIWDLMGGIMKQEIVPDYTIEIRNQRGIMKELDMVGINKRMIYGDFDSTAQYINTKQFPEKV